MTIMMMMMMMILLIVMMNMIMLPFLIVLHIVSAYFLGRFLGFVCRIETREATVVRGR
jgi:hypothetical protein